MRRAAAVSLAAFALASLSLAENTRPRRTYDLIDVAWSVDLTGPFHTVRGTVVNTVAPFKGVRRIWFDSARLRIGSVKVNGKAAKFELQGDKLWVDILPGLTRAQVEIAYSGEPQAGLYFIPAERAFPANTPVVWTQGEMIETRHYIPTYDWPDDKATTQGTITVPAGWNVLSNGKLVAKTALPGNKTRFQWKMDQPHVTYLISIVAGPFSEIVDGKVPSGGPVSFWVPKGLEAMGRASYSNTQAMVDEFGRLTGFKYPYAKYSQAMVPDFTFGGMENITATTNTIGSLHPEHTYPIDSAEGLNAHELAHQWFGDTVTTPNWSHIWINEGWASFMPSFIVRKMHGQAAFDIQRNDILSGAHGAQASGRKPMVRKDYKNPIEMFDGMAYGGGAARMFMLMDLVGEARFWEATRKYLEECKYQNVDTERFFKIWSKNLGMDLDWFRRQWFYRAEAPNLTVVRKDGKLVVRQSAPYYRIPTSVLGSNGQRVRVNIDGPETVLPIEAQLVLLDPDAWTMANIKYDLGWNAADWRRLYLLAPNAGQKARLIPQMLPSMDDADKTAMAFLETESRLVERWVPHVKSETALMRMLGGTPQVRLAALRQLGSIAAGDDARKALEAAAEGDKNDHMRLAAMQSLYRLTDDAKWPNRAWNTNGHKEMFRTWALSVWQNSDPNRARVVALAEVRSPRNEALRLAAIRALGVVKELPGDKAVRLELQKIALEPSNSARSSAISALGVLGDPAAIPTLERVATHARYGEAAKRAIARIRERR